MRKRKDRDTSDGTGPPHLEQTKEPPQTENEEPFSAMVEYLRKYFGGERLEMRYLAAMEDIYIGLRDEVKTLKKAASDGNNTSPSVGTLSGEPERSPGMRWREERRSKSG